jgi:hypothetical protein
MAGRALRVIADVSCDPTSPYNPIPIYGSITSWEAPTVRVATGPNPCPHAPSLPTLCHSLPHTL